MTPRLTVVVPVHNVERYLDACLASIAAQTLPDLDVVVVDDGSTDSGPRIAAAWAARDPRFRLVCQDNGGLGRARNTGTGHADPRTSYLAFVDSDDVLPPRAYEKLVGLLEGTGSDFATGNVYRLTPDGRAQAWQQRGMSRTVRRTHVTRDLSLLSDRVAWNKVFRRAFWDKHALAFPEGVLYEDTPVTMRAHFLADAVDVLHDHVYYWRLREGSITRRRTDVKGVRDRIAGVDGVSRFLADPAHSHLSAYKRAYDRSVLTDDLPYFVEALPMAGPEYQRVFMDRARDYLTRVDPALHAELPVELRMRWHLIGEGRLADLLTVLEHGRTGGRTVFDLAGPPLRKHAVLRRPDGSPVPLPRAATALGTRDLPVTARVRETAWRDGRLVLKGYAYIRNVDARSRRSSLKTAVAMSGRRTLLLPVRTVAAPEVTAASGQERHCYDWSGFEITVDPRRLRRGGRWQPGRWRIGIVVAAGSLIRPAALRPDDGGPSPSPYPLDADTRLVPRYDDGRLHLSVERVGRRLTGHRPADDGSAVLLELAVPDGERPVALRLRREGTDGAPEGAFEYPVRAGAAGGATTAGGAAAVGDGAEAVGAAEAVRSAGAAEAVGAAEAAEAVEGGAVEAAEAVEGEVAAAAAAAEAVDAAETAEPGPSAGDGWTRVTAAVRLADPVAARPAAGGLPEEVAPETTAAWSAELVLPDGASAAIAVDGPLPSGGYPLGPDPRLGGALRELALGASAAGHLVLLDRTAEPVADAVSRTGPGRLRIDGALPSGVEGAEGLPRLVLRHGTFAAETSTAVATEGPRFCAEVDVSALPHPGPWHLRLRTAAGPDAPVRIARSAVSSLPLDLSADHRSLRLDRRSHDHLSVSASDFVPAADRGAYRQRLLRERRYPELSRRPLLTAVLYSSFDGRGCDDSPRAVHDELVRRGAALDHVWVVRDRTARVPVSARSVVYGSHDWYEALARSRYVITNTHLPAWFRRRDGQRVVQTWHGTPVKRFGLDLEGTPCADLAHLWPQPRRGGQWSALVSPNAPSTAVLRRALHVHGEIAETGLPRTDPLCAEDREKVAEDVRARLGLPPDRTVVLYAPTVRDDESYDADHHRLHLPLDLAALADALSDSHVLLIRAHPLVADTVPTEAGGGPALADGFVRDVTPRPGAAPARPGAGADARPDLAELLLATDVLVTDYSAVLADFAVTGRPILLYTPDLAHYRDRLRGFAFDYERAAPGPLLASTGELIEALRDPQTACLPYEQAYAAFRAAFCHLDDGGAAARVADLLLG
ncbi:CDP-glycerol glycerophosphotransferase family protein [Streptomyces sp.]|uniref:CDP-glycerol glycerophosphotransferase family protein n=1 Tax=Streptomyces sp. TaxID=1931 RepID=UPI002F41E52C